MYIQYIVARLRQFIHRYDVATISKQIEKGSSIGHTNNDCVNAPFYTEDTMHNIEGQCLEGGPKYEFRYDCVKSLELAR